MGSLHALWHSTVLFGDRVVEVHMQALLVAIGFLFANLFLRATAWRTILQAGYQHGRVRWRTTAGAYLAGVGVNALVPARAGDVTKVYLAHRGMPGAAYTTITSSLVAETLLDMVIGPVLLLAALATGRLPSLGALQHLSAFESSFMAAHARWFAVAVAVLLIALGIFFGWVERHVTSFWDRVRDGFAIIRTPRRWALRVLMPQTIGWGCRAAAMYFFLRAFAIPASGLDALLALSAASVSTLLPLTPGGIGTQQALLGYMFRSNAPAAAVLSFSVGMQLTVTVTYAVVGGLVLGLMMRRLPWRARVPGRDGDAPQPS
ncbi:MAG TPA: lysylphosphatidylglycerol synthase transmembrane domain-containing protein [Gaiellales bacterium]|nr:lysylphosphatidylglycerol synthase transmembrane domain-containing protein [Gaiellales bacterium]